MSLLAIGTMVCVALVPATAAAQAKPAGAPAELKVGFVDFLSGPAVLFGASGKNTVEWLVDEWNKKGGIRGVKVKLVIVDEAGGPDKQVTEFRRLASTRRWMRWRSSSETGVRGGRTWAAGILPRMASASFMRLCMSTNGGA